LRLVALLVVASSQAWAATAEIEAEARRLEGLLMAPCCGANTLADHDSGPAHEMKREIRELLASGSTSKEILDHYVAEHGHTILARPPATGFNLVAYLVPLVALVLGPWLMWRKLRQIRPEEPSDAPPAVVDPVYRERLERELGRR
jgi:cytochrome c-type biogenesis protein CcmH